MKGLSLSNILQGENCNILFFILVFLFLFQNNGGCSDTSEGDDCSMLFFIIIFILLFVANKDVERES